MSASPARRRTPAFFSNDERRRLLEMDIDLGGVGDSELWRAFSVVYNCLTLPSDSLSFCYALTDGARRAAAPGVCR